MLIRCPIQHLYPLEVCATNEQSTRTVEPTVDEREDDPEDTAPTPNAEVANKGRTRSNPPRIAAQVARYRLQELAEDDASQEGSVG